MLTLKQGGADCVLCASNPLSTQDDVAASLVRHFYIPVFARKGEGTKTYYRHLDRALDHKPHVTMDDGADLITQIHRRRKRLADAVIGGTEETTTGVIRLRSMEARGVLLFPVLAINDARTKHFFDNRYGTGQSTLDGIVRATNMLLAGAIFVISGYGWCGRGLSEKARGMGARVVVTEIDPLKALEAVMDGFEVMSLREAAPLGDIFVTVTGNLHVIRKEHFLLMKDGAVIANSGHFDSEIDIPALRKLSKRVRPLRDFVQEFTLRDGRHIHLLAEGRLVNLSAAEGHPPSVMDMSFSNQALGVEFLIEKGSELRRHVYPVPEEIDQKVAKLKLKAMGVTVDPLTQEQLAYLASWELGT